MGLAVNRRSSIRNSVGRKAFPWRNGGSGGRAGKYRTHESHLRYRLRRHAMSTDCLFREDSYLKECSATVVGLTDAGGVMLDRTVFYAASGGQPADRGALTTATGDSILVENATYLDADKTEIAHLPAIT